MQQYFAIKKEDNVLILNKDDLNHIKNVMRMKIGNKIIANYEGVSYVCSLNKDLLSCEIIEIFKKINSDGYVCVYVPLFQEDKMGLVLQKGTELGVDEFIIVQYEHCKYKLPKKDYEKKLLRWNKIVKEASEQSYRINKPIIKNIITVSEMTSNSNVNILCSLVKNDVKYISEILNSENCNDTINVAFGPEGGFTKSEEEILVCKGFEKVSLGSNVLRSETVIIYIMSVIMYLKGRV